MLGKIYLKVALLGTAIALGAAPVGAGEIDDLKAEIEALQERLGKLEAAQKEAAQKTVTAGATGGWKLPGSDTSISLSGYVKGDFYVDNSGAPGTTLGVGYIRLKDEEPNDDIRYGMHAQQSGLRISSHTPTSYGALNTVLAGDFNPYGDGSTPRMTDVYGEFGPVLVGQTWSLLVDEDTAASTIDFDGPIGTFAHRTRLLRLSVPIGEGLTGQAAIEEGGEGNEMPTLTAAMRYRAGWGAVNLAGGFGRVDRGGQFVSGNALHLGAHFNVTDATQLMATFNMSSGMNSGEGYGLIFADADGVAMVDGKLKGQESMGGIAGVSHGWSDTISTGVYFGWVQNDAASGASDADVAGMNKALQTLHANVMWSPVPQASIGLEFARGWREIYPKVDGNGMIDGSKATKGEATRVQLGLLYSF